MYKVLRSWNVHWILEGLPGSLYSGICLCFEEGCELGYVLISLRPEGCELGYVLSSSRPGCLEEQSQV